MEPAPTITGPSPSVQPDGTDKVQALMAAIAQAQRRYSLDYVWTLTIRTATCAAEKSDKATKTFWARLRRALWRRYGLFDFVLIREVTQRGLAHLHVYSSLRVPEDELRALWSAATGGSWVVKVQRVHPGRLVEYLTKQLHVHASVPSLHGRDWTTSQRIRLLDLIPARARARARSTLDAPSGVKHTRTNEPPASGAPGAPLTGPESLRGDAADPRPASDAVPRVAAEAGPASDAVPGVAAEPCRRRGSQPAQ